MTQRPVVTSTSVFDSENEDVVEVYTEEDRLEEPGMRTPFWLERPKEQSKNACKSMCKMFERPKQQLQNASKKQYGSKKNSGSSSSSSSSSRKDQ